jgi:hypothetical protein
VNEASTGAHADERRARIASLDLVAAGLALAAAIASFGTVLDQESWLIVWLLFAPVAAASLPLAVSGVRARQVARIVASILLLGWCVIAAASVGLFYLPSAVAMIASAIRGRR